MLTREQIQELLQTGQISPEQAQALIQRINENVIAQLPASINEQEIGEILSSVEQAGRGGFGPGALRPFTESTFNIPGTGIGVNAPLLGIGATLATLGIGAPAAAGAGGIAARSILPGLATRALGTRAAAVAGRVIPAGARTISRGRVTGAGIAGITAFGAGSIIGGEQQAGEPTPPVTPPGTPVPPTDGGAAAAAQAAVGTGGPQAPALPGLGADAVAGIPQRVEIRDEQGQGTGQFVTILNGQVIEQEGELTESERLALESSRARAVTEQATTSRAAEAELQRTFQAEESRRAREAQLFQSLLPILASPGNRFRFAANISRLGGGQAGFEPTGAFNELFRIAGQQPGAINPLAGRDLGRLTGAELAQLTGQVGSTQQGRLQAGLDRPSGTIPLTGQQEFSIIPNVQQLAELTGGGREELNAIIGELSGLELGQIQRRSRRLAPPGGGGPRAIIGR